MKLRRMIKAASLLWGVYRVYRRSTHRVRMNTKRALRKAERAI